MSYEEFDGYGYFMIRALAIIHFKRKRQERKRKARREERKGEKGKEETRREKRTENTKGDKKRRKKGKET